jgi:hypothetical protein
MASGAVESRNKEDKMFQEYEQSEFSPCLHRHVKVITKGRMQFSGGDVWDDLQDQVLCLDCMCTLTQMEVRESWMGRSTSTNANIMEK